MAANKPMAGATNTSAIPGATTFKLAWLTLAKARKEFMIPHTVPNKPIYGLVEPTVAKKGNVSYKRFCSRCNATRIARCEPSITASGSREFFDKRINSSNPAVKIARWPQFAVLSSSFTRRYSVARSSPDQNSLSNARPTLRACRITRARTKITAHDSTDISTSSNITACTTKPAPLTKLQIDIESCITATPSLTPLVPNGVTLVVLNYRPAHRPH